VSFDTAKLVEVLRGAQGKRVLVLGDLIADEYIYGETSRVSREAPVLIIRHVGRKVIPGGAGNAVLNLHSLGLTPIPVGVIGAGEISGELLAELSNRGIETAGVLRDRERVAVRKTRVMAGGAHGQKQQVMRIDQEDRVPLSSSLEERLREIASEYLDGSDAVLLSDYGYGVLAAGVRDSVIAAANARGLPVCADSRHALREFVGVTFATPNELEAAESWGRPIESRTDLRRAAEALRTDLEAEFLLLTRGHDGMAIAERDGGFHEVAVWGSDEAADTTGAGDTVAAAALAALSAGATPLEAAQLATLAAGIVVQKHGAATTTTEEIERVAGLRRQAVQRR
jgi:rfaE bifunctional protein kinase chain/domain